MWVVNYSIFLNINKYSIFIEYIRFGLKHKEEGLRWHKLTYLSLALVNPRGKFRPEARRRGYSAPFIKKYRRYAFALKQKKRMGEAKVSRHAYSKFRTTPRPAPRRRPSKVRKVRSGIRAPLPVALRAVGASRAWCLKKQRALREDPAQKLAQTLYRKLRGRIRRQGLYRERRGRIRSARLYS